MLYIRGLPDVLDERVIEEITSNLLQPKIKLKNEILEVETHDEYDKLIQLYRILQILRYYSGNKSLSLEITETSLIYLREQK